MSRRLHRALQTAGMDDAARNDSDTAPVFDARGRRVLGYVDREGNFITAIYGRPHYVARIFLLSDPYKLRLIRRTRFANVKSLRHGRCYGFKRYLP
jgi:hypothetical protein